jgi:hypothetical protein
MDPFLLDDIPLTDELTALLQSTEELFGNEANNANNESPGQRVPNVATETIHEIVQKEDEKIQKRK